MGTPNLSLFLRRLVAEHHIVLLGGLAVIHHGLSRPTKDAGVWLEPMDSAQLWAECLRAAALDFPAVIAFARLPGWEPVHSVEKIALAVEETGMIRVTGLEVPLDVFRRPNELEEEAFDSIWLHGTPNDDGLRVAHPVDLLLSKEDTGRERDIHDQRFLEGKIREEWTHVLVSATAVEAEALLARYADHAVCAAALRNPDPAVQALARGLLEEMAAQGDWFSRDVLAGLKP